jgi:hypothetical protein
MSFQRRFLRKLNPTDLRLGASHCKMPLLGFLASATLATSIGRLMEGDAPVSPAARPTWGTCGGTDCC